MHLERLGQVLGVEGRGQVGRQQLGQVGAGAELMHLVNAHKLLVLHDEIARAPPTPPTWPG